MPKMCIHTICSDSLQCCYLRLEQLAWAVCSRFSLVSFNLVTKLKKINQKGNWLETWQCLVQTLSSKKQYLEKQMKKLVCLLVALAALLPLSGCSTFSQSPFFAQSSQVSNSSPSPLPKTKKPSQSYGDSSNSQVEQTLPQRSQRDISLWSASPLWGQ